MRWPVELGLLLSLALPAMGMSESAAVAQELRVACCTDPHCPVRNASGASVDFAAAEQSMIAALFWNRPAASPLPFPAIVQGPPSAVEQLQADVQRQGELLGMMGDRLQQQLEGQERLAANQLRQAQDLATLNGQVQSSQQQLDQRLKRISNQLNQQKTQLVQQLQLLQSQLQRDLQENQQKVLREQKTRLQELDAQLRKQVRTLDEFKKRQEKSQRENEALRKENQTLKKRLRQDAQRNKQPAKKQPSKKQRDV